MTLCFLIFGEWMRVLGGELVRLFRRVNEKEFVREIVCGKRMVFRRRWCEFLLVVEFGILSE